MVKMQHIANMGTYAGHPVRQWDLQNPGGGVASSQLAQQLGVSVML
jgi:hypothetical protein